MESNSLSTDLIAFAEDLEKRSAELAKRIIDERGLQSVPPFATRCDLVLCECRRLAKSLHVPADASRKVG